MTGSASSNWWYASNGSQKGPVNDQELQRLVISGALGSHSLVWKQGMEKWEPVSQIESLSNVLASEGPTGSRSNPTRPKPIPVKGSRTLLRRITTLLALVLLIAVWLGVGIYGQENPIAGLARAFGFAAPLLLILGAIAWFRRKRSSPFPWDIGLAVTAVWLVLGNLNQITTTLDVERFQTEARSSSADEALAASETQFADFVRGTISISQETANTIQGIFVEVDDPALTNALSMAALRDPDVMRRAQEVAKEKLGVARAAMPRIDSALQNELAQLRKLGDDFPEDLAKSVVQGTQERHDRWRPLYQRMADLNIRFLEEMDATLGFLLSRVGNYTVADSGGVLFHATADIDQYNTHISNIQALAVEEDRIRQDLVREDELSRQGFNRALSGSQ